MVSPHEYTPAVAIRDIDAFLSMLHPIREGAGAQTPIVHIGWDSIAIIESIMSLDEMGLELDPGVVAIREHC